MTNKVLETIENLRIVKASKKIVLPGFDGIPFYDVMVFFVKGLMKGALNTRATSMSFQFFLSLFPALIFLFSLIPFVPIENFQEGLMTFLENLLPSSAWDLTEETIDDIINQPRPALLSFIFIAVVYLATNGVDALLESFSESVNIKHVRGYFHQKGVAFILLSILTLLVIVGISLLIYSTIVADDLEEGGQIIAAQLMNWSKWIIGLSMIYFGISILYYYGNRKRDTWKFFSAGSTLSTILFVVLSYAFAFYVNNMAMYNKLYGSIGTLLVILLYIYFNSFVLLIGFELNASIQQAGFQRKLKID